MKFLPETLGYRVLIKPFIEKVSAGGIVIARDDRQQAINTDKGTILMIGTDCWSNLANKPKFKVGMKVMYAKYGAKTIQDVDNPEVFYILANDQDLLAGYKND